MARKESHYAIIQGRNMPYSHAFPAFLLPRLPLVFFPCLRLFPPGIVMFFFVGHCHFMIDQWPPKDTGGWGRERTKKPPIHQRKSGKRRVAGLDKGSKSRTRKPLLGLQRAWPNAQSPILPRQDGNIAKTRLPWPCLQAAPSWILQPHLGP